MATNYYPANFFLGEPAWGSFSWEKKEDRKKRIFRGGEGKESMPVCGAVEEGFDFPRRVRGWNQEKKRRRMRRRMRRRRGGEFVLRGTG